MSAALDFAFPLLIVTVALAVAFVLWRLRVAFAKRVARRRTAGYQLMDCLKAYTVWVDWQRDEPLMHAKADALTVPPPLEQAVRIKDAHFPELSPLMLKLLQTHRELMQYLWEQHILRLTHAGLPPHYADPRYHQLRDTQDAALDSLFMRCRQLIGDDGSEWKRTRSDFSFSGDMNLPSRPFNSP
ncbi:hypothetical protein WG902_01110 [Ramlibacter sp. PS3R-8]|uniref:hypothetical protein n=1 Tax=Ramlibacter sp. PS3R-8 TaxID=3133437 RepID=UPI0030A825FD